jgi:hypothetical protein
MTKIMRTLASLFAAQEEEKPAATPETPVTESPTTNEPAAEGDKPVEDPAPAPTPETATEAKEQNTVNLSLADYEKLVGLASDAKDARAAAMALKVKADQWDTYQSALSGGKPAGDTAGSGSASQAPKSEVAALREKHAALMEDIED